MSDVSVYEAKNKLSALIDAVAHGAEVTITRRGVPVARLVSIEQTSAPLSARLQAVRDSLRAQGVHATRDELRAFITEGRR